jgi:hypothetical protein
MDEEEWIDQYGSEHLKLLYKNKKHYKSLYNKEYLAYNFIGFKIGTGNDLFSYRADSEPSEQDLILLDIFREKLISICDLSNIKVTNIDVYKDNLGNTIVAAACDAGYIYWDSTVTKITLKTKQSSENIGVYVFIYVLTAIMSFISLLIHFTFMGLSIIILSLFLSIIFKKKEN